MKQLPILRQAAKFLCKVSYQQLSAEAISTARMAILDYIAVAIPGSQEPVAVNLRNWAASRSHGQSATVFGSQQRFDAGHAALVNAAAGHALDFDDTSWATIGHPTTVILPALLALAETESESTSATISGRDVLLAYVCGVEVSHKIAELMMPEISENGWHTTGAFYGLGTAAAACQLLQLDEDQTTTALALALSRASGIRSNFGTQAKPYHAGMAATAGLEAVSLSQAGITAADTALEGQDGFIQCFASERLADIARNMAKPVLFGTNWDIAHRGYAFKKYPNCSGNHPACDAILEYLSEQSLAAEDIAEIHCGVSLLGPKELVCDLPQTPVEARFSIQFSLACALLHGRITLEEFHTEVIRHPDMQSLMQKIMMEVDEDLAMLGFIGTAPVKIRITKHNGEVIKLANDLARGNPEKPFTDAEFIAKFNSCVQQQMCAESSAQLLQLIRKFDTLDSLSPLMELLSQQNTSLTD